MAALTLGLGLGGLALIYAVGWRRLARRSAAPIALARPALALGGLLTICLALAPPLDDLAHARFAAHMLQHLLLTTIAAPVLLLADPFAAVLWALPRGARRTVGRCLASRAPLRRLAAFLVRPPVAGLLGAATMWLWHAPALYDRALASDLLHGLEHVTLFAGGVLLWWPVIQPAPRLRAPAPHGVRIVYLVLAAFQGAALGLLLALSPQVLYATYAAAPDALEDQSRGGVVLWALGSVVDMGAALRLLWMFLGRGDAAPTGARIDRPRALRDNGAVQRMTARHVLIQATGIRKAFGGHLVLDDVGLEVGAGEAVALLGANGAGKTTLLRILATLLRPSRGEVSVAGYDGRRQPERVRARVGLLGHGAWVYEDLTAFENLRFWATLSGWPSDGDALRSALGAVELDRVADDRVRTFSQGMKRRLALARLLLARPSVVLLDEPFAGLDQRAGKWLDEHLATVKAAGGAIVIATHTFGRGLGVADRILILAAGRVALDTPAGTLTPEDIRRLYELHAEEPA